jgi:hypothetical protein
MQNSYINSRMMYTTPCVMFLVCADPLPGQVRRGWEKVIETKVFKKKLCAFCYLLVLMNRRKSRPIESNAKCLHLEKLTCKGIWRQVFICLKTPPFLGFFFGWCSNIVGSESGQKQRVNYRRLWSPSQINTPPPPPNHTLSRFEGQ